jgi:hypothetical protein
VASTKEEALLLMHNGLLAYDDIEDPGKASAIRCNRSASMHEKLNEAAKLLQKGARFILPRYRLTRADIMLIVTLLL